MITRNKYRILIWVIAILLATNLSMGISFLYHKQQDKKRMEQVEEEVIEVPAQRRTRFFRQQLNLQPEQMGTFRELNREFNRAAWRITHELGYLRRTMVEELGQKNPDHHELEAIADNIGELHSEMKKETINYYLSMRETCNGEQRKKLNAIFMSMLIHKEDVELPQRGRRQRDNW
jgi:Spy/CpxP family protein refolding chaperone